jgi:ABC-type sugar transport system ATPase subunit
MELRGITKTFGETRALQGLSLELRSGEVLGIAGPNGAGKSTLIRILAGEEQRDQGDIVVNGVSWSPGDPEDRVAVVHQEPQLWPNLTVAQNLLVGREPSAYAFPTLPPADRALLHQLDIDGYADQPLAECPLAIRQRVEIARALARDARFFLFDEPNSALTEEESDRLFAFIHDLANRGCVVMLVSHRLGEMVAHCDRLVVIRDGRVAATLVASGLTEAAIARELVLGYQAVGTDSGVATAIDDAAPMAATAAAAPTSGDAAGAEPAVFSVEHWSAVDGAFSEVSLAVARGEILALVGVEGSGAREMVASAAGFAVATGSASVGALDGRQAIVEGTAYLPADRRGMLFANLTVGDNLVMRLGAPDIAVAGGFLSRGRLRATADDLVARFHVRTASSRAPLTSLSGGNQQKVAIAAAIARQPTLLVLEEPTRGVDVGSKAEIYRILRAYARAGHGVLVFCTEIPEVYELADSVQVVDGGRPGPRMAVAAFGDLTALADAIASGERTSVEPEDLVASGGHAAPDAAPAGRFEE